MRTLDGDGLARALGVRASRRGVARGLAAGALAGAAASLGGPAPAAAAAQIEPRAGGWRTWLLPSVGDVRPPPPPTASWEVAAEVAGLKDLEVRRTAAARDQVAWWDAGGPSYRWNDLAVSWALKGNMNSVAAARVLSLLHAAIYDAIVATWDAKYAYNRPRPAEYDTTLNPLLPTPASPSYPAEHAAAAGAASTVLAYAFPAGASSFAAMADEAAQSRLLAGVQYPSDVTAGLALGRAVGALAVERGRADGSDQVWTGTVPTGPGMWTGSNPILPLAGTWKAWVLPSNDAFRAPPPPAYDSEQKLAELAELKSFPRTPKTNADASFWEFGAGGPRGFWFWNDRLSRKVLEYRLDANPPRAARAFALANIALLDSGIAGWESKYTYWAIRPSQLDPELRTVVPNPNHPSYPAAHGFLSGGTAAMLGYLFPRDAASLNALADEAAEARVWAGIHYRSDIVAGLALGRAVARLVAERGSVDSA